MRSPHLLRVWMHDVKAPPVQENISGVFYDHFLKKEPSPVKILYAGKIARAKGVPWLLKSLFSVKEDFELDLVGSGTKEEEEVCFELAGQINKKINIHGKVEQKSLSALMKKAHIFVFPSFFEGLPLVLLEAFASGTRVVTTSLKGTRELFRKPSKYVDVVDMPALETIDSPFKKDEILLNEE